MRAIEVPCQKFDGEAYLHRRHQSPSATNAYRAVDAGQMSEYTLTWLSDQTAGKGFLIVILKSASALML